MRIEISCHDYGLPCGAVEELAHIRSGPLGAIDVVKLQGNSLEVKGDGLSMHAITTLYGVFNLLAAGVIPDWDAIAPIVPTDPGVEEQPVAQQVEW